MNFKQKAEQLWKRIGDVLQFRELAIIFGGGSFAAAVARYANARNLLAFFATLTAFAAGGLIALALIWLFQILRYLIRGRRTTLDVFGGLNWTVVVNHSGPPVRVRVRVQMAEVGDELDQHFEPFDLHLSTGTYGPSLQIVELTGEINFAKAVVASMQTLDRTAKQLDFHLPGLGNKSCVVQERGKVLLVMGVWLFVASPLGVRKTYETHKAIAELDGFHTQDRTEEQKRLDSKH